MAKGKTDSKTEVPETFQIMERVRGRDGRGQKRVIYVGDDSKEIEEGYVDLGGAADDDVVDPGQEEKPPKPAKRPKKSGGEGGAMKIKEKTFSDLLPQGPQVGGPWTPIRPEVGM